MNCRACDTTRRHMVAVREENDALRDQIAGLEQDLKRARFGEPWTAPNAWKLTKPENRLLRAFRTHGFLTKAAAFSAVYHDRHVADTPETDTITVFLCRLRKRLRPHGVEIYTRWGQGWGIDDANRARLDELTKPTESTE